jgi:hypothetical protein
MSYALDVNVLLYASDSESPFHGRAVDFLQRCAQDGEVMCLGWPTVMAYLRIATHPSIFRAPLTPDEAQRNITSLLGLHQVRVLSEKEGFWDVYREVTKGLTVRGNLVPDAHLAALLRQHDVRIIYTNDADYHKFRFLDVRNPLN